MGDSSYLLGTHTEELERLRFQHELWLPAARAAWQRAGLGAGMRVLDVGAGPGFAAMDLARPTLQTLGRVDLQRGRSCPEAVAHADALLLEHPELVRAHGLKGYSLMTEGTLNALPPGTGTTAAGEGFACQFPEAFAPGSPACLDFAGSTCSRGGLGTVPG